MFQEKSPPSHQLMIHVEDTVVFVLQGTAS